jgi:hypothetical protein
MNSKQRHFVEAKAAMDANAFNDAIGSGNKDKARIIVNQTLMTQRQKEMIIHHYDL